MYVLDLSLDDIEKEHHIRLHGRCQHLIEVNRDGYVNCRFCHGDKIGDLSDYRRGILEMYRQIRIKTWQGKIPPPGKDWDDEGPWNKTRK